MARPKAMSDNTLYGLIIIINAALFTAMLMMKLIDGNVFLGGVTLGTTIGTAMIGKRSKSTKESDAEIEELRQQIEELKNKS